MGIFDKISGIARDFSTVAGDIADSTKGAAADLRSEYEARKQEQLKKSIVEPSHPEPTENAEMERRYIPPTINIAQTVPSGPQVPAPKGVAPQKREFSLCGVAFPVSEAIDRRRAYIVDFDAEAEARYEEFVKRCEADIRDLRSLFEVMPSAYDEGLYPILKRASAFLNAEGVWDVSYEALTLSFKRGCCMFASGWDMVTSLAQKKQQDAQKIASFVSGLTNVAAQGALDAHMYRRASRGAGGTLSSMVLNNLGVYDKIDAGSSTASSIIGGLAAGVMTGGAALTEDEQEEIYTKVRDAFGLLYKAVWVDYHAVALALFDILRQRGCDIGPAIVPDQEINRQTVMLENVRGVDPSLPGVARAMVDALAIDPFNPMAYEVFDEVLPGDEGLADLKAYFLAAPDPAWLIRQQNEELS